MRAIRLLSVTLAVLTVGLLAAPGAAAEPPLLLRAQLTDNVHLLDGTGRARVQDAIDELYADRKVRLWVVYVDSFGSQDPGSWGRDTFRLNDFGDNDALLGAAAADRSYVFLARSGTEISSSRFDDLRRNQVEPALRQGDWSGAAVRAANGLNRAPESGGRAPLLIVLGGVAAAGSLLLVTLLLVIRRRNKRRRDSHSSVVSRVDRHDAETLAAVPLRAPDDLPGAVVGAGTRLFPGDEFAGYRIIKMLGEGGMGQVWLAEHTLLGRREALKIVSVHAADSEFARRFTTEARTAAALDHPGIVTVYAYGITDGTPWFTMTYLDGEDLTHCGPLPPHEVAFIIERIADALDFAHTRGVIHRDVKPANVVVQRTPDGALSRVTVLDFGIARLVDGTQLTATNAFLGTLSYAPPETLTGQPAVPQSDQYSLACTAFHLLTGRPPFHADNPGSLMMSHINGPIPRLRDVFPALAPLDAVLTRGLAKSPEQRFSTSGEFAAALRVAVTGLAPNPAPSIDVPQPESAHGHPASRSGLD